ncbi:Alpha/Beta hydrolase protein [Phycomyces blakesleeanus]|uniref:Alpha/Beta hydrolase protein n=1 Tax=Phycomyces blakesleeanus TaxID=4837 RepID=A0ABR3BD80_PHYBL
MPVTPHYVAPRAPIVLCHGLYGFDLWGPDAFPALQFHYWQGIEDALAKLGAKVIVTGVPKTGSIRERAQELHAVLKAIMKDKDVNFVAHSMGGLDCRYLLSHIKDRPYRPRSLTTICTPHQGSPVMDWFRDHVGVGEQKPGNPCNQRSLSAMTVSMKNSVTRTEEFATASMMAYYNHHHNNNDDDDDLHNQKLLNLKLKLGLLPKAMIDYFDEPAYGNLTTDYCQEFFNPNTPDDLGVQYYSYGAAAKIPAWSSLLSTPWQIVKDKEGDNDGIVSIKSAKWGKYIKTVEADHWDLSGKR